ncbi:hypothetical protein TIFTF001_025568 [Ficus carica]|uniref:Staygreen protein domain-containing protein n=1 Tax=Ficus carica TaxID=3494 RepID=A0AA88DGP5_FICCA|nr:hypothetical protein TIFTF001_025568 [Ficus carica]
MACHCSVISSSSSSSSSSSYGGGVLPSLAMQMRNVNIMKSNSSSPNFVMSSNSKRTNFALLCSFNRDSYTTVVSEAVRLLGAPARFEASKLKVLRGWYSKDDVVAEWKKVNGDMCLHVHCFVSGPNLLSELAAELRYQIFSKELPLVLKAVLHGDSALLTEHPELLDSLVRVYFHSSLQKYNKMECWGPLRDAIEGRQVDRIQRLLTISSVGSRKWKGPKAIFQALFALLL